jgi:ABC-2 type transport system permease protein
VVAFLMSLVGCVIPFAVGYALHQVPDALLPVVQYMSFEYHFNNLARGVIDSRDVIYYGSVVALSLHVAVFALERRRLA